MKKSDHFQRSSLPIQSLKAGVSLSLYDLRVLVCLSLTSCVAFENGSHECRHRNHSLYSLVMQESVYVIDLQQVEEKKCVPLKRQLLCSYSLYYFCELECFKICQRCFSSPLPIGEKSTLYIAMVL